MLFEKVAQWYESGVDYHICNADEYGDPGAVDMTAVYPTLQNTGDLVFVVQVRSSGTSGTDTYEFQLRGSATTDGTDLNGTVVNLVTSPVFTQSGGWCQKTDHSGGLFVGQVPALARDYRYWQAYIDITNVAGNLDLQVYMFLALEQAVRVPVGNISSASGIVGP
jgi:hypothetical protein